MVLSICFRMEIGKKPNVYVGMLNFVTTTTI